MDTITTSTSAPTLPNPRGKGLVIAAAITLAAVTIVVFLRVWGRYRYSNIPRETRNLRIGDYRLWILLSDVTILISFVLAIVLTVIALVGVHWGFGIHQKKLSRTQAQNVLEMFFLYQIFYKFAAGISKIATVSLLSLLLFLMSLSRSCISWSFTDAKIKCFLLLAISTSQMKTFNLTCQIMAIYIAGYCFACSIATVFQCNLDISSNWDHSKNQAHCFLKTPFWYTHAALNIIASVIIACLPWWLFAKITYKRKYLIATLMSLLATSEIVVGCVRLYGLYVSSHSLTDLTYGAITGVVVSQLEVNFGIMSACIPTVMKISEELLGYFLHIFFRRELPQRTIDESHSRSRTSTQFSTIDRKSPVKVYERFGGEDDLESTHSGSSREDIIKRENGTELGQIKVETSFFVEETSGDSEDPATASKKPTHMANATSQIPRREYIG